MSVHGSRGVADENNLGRIGNAGSSWASSGVVASTPARRTRTARRLLAAIARVTELPVRVALVSHTRPEFLFGGSGVSRARHPGAHAPAHRRA
jgi:hypothetical protein